MMGHCGRYLESSRAVVPLCAGQLCTTHKDPRDHPPGRQDDNSAGVLFERSSHTGQRQRLGRLGRSRRQLPELVKLGRVADGGFGEESGLGHHADGLERVVALGGFTGQHDTVGAVEDGVGDVGDFGSGGSGVILDRVRVRYWAPSWLAYAQLTVMDSSIWVAQMTGFPATLHLAIIIFWAIKT